MNVTKPVWQDKVSSVFDFSKELLLIVLKNGIEKSRNAVPVAEQSGMDGKKMAIKVVF